MAVRWTRAKTVVAVVVGAAGFAAALITIVNDGWSLHDRFTPEEASLSPVVAVSPSAPETPPGLRPTRNEIPPPTTPRSPDCRLDNGSGVDCQLAHRYEVYHGTCDDEGLVSWLGGRPDIDIPRGAVRGLGDGQCLADLKASVKGMAGNGFARENDSLLRRCFDGRTASVVPCSEPHTGEYVAADVDGIATDGDCAKAARSYLDVAIAQRSDELRVRAIKSPPQDGARARCMIEVIGSQRLDRTVRNLRNSQLHWVP